MVPIVVVDGEGPEARPVVIDGYRRIRALCRLGREIVKAVRWELPEMDALLLRRALMSARGESS